MTSRVKLGLEHVLGLLGAPSLRANYTGLVAVSLAEPFALPQSLRLILFTHALLFPSLPVVPALPIYTLCSLLPEFSSYSLTIYHHHYCFGAIESLPVSTVTCSLEFRLRAGTSDTQTESTSIPSPLGF